MGMWAAQADVISSPFTTSSTWRPMLPHSMPLGRTARAHHPCLLLGVEYFCLAFCWQKEQCQLQACRACLSKQRSNQTKSQTVKPRRCPSALGGTVVCSMFKGPCRLTRLHELAEGAVPTAGCRARLSNQGHTTAHNHRPSGCCGHLGLHLILPLVSHHVVLELAEGAVPTAGFLGHI